MRRAARKDGNQKEIEKRLSDIGLPWVDTSRLGNGFPDLLVAVCGVWHAIEVKIPGEDLTIAERGFHVKFRNSAPLHIAYGADDVLVKLGLVEPPQTTQEPRRRAKYAKNAME